jgi:hypothetical protein
MSVLLGKFAAVVSAVAVLVAQAACVCHAASGVTSTAAAAVAHGAPSKPAHACCKHTSDNTPDSRPGPTRSPVGCRHCSGLITAMSRPTADATVAGPILQAPAFAIALSVPTVVSPQATHREFAREASLPLSATLLRLHCALTL